MYKELFKKDLENYLKIKGLEKKIQISYSDFEDYQYQTSIAISNKDIVVEDLVTYLKLQEKYEKVNVTGKGFVSVVFNLNDIELIKEKPLKIVLDYCGVNVAKKMHIGHIRSMFIGDYIFRLHEKKGDQVIKLNHVGDWGNQFGYLLNYIQKNNLENSLTNELLTDYYKEANKLNNENIDFAKESATVAYNLQNNLDQDVYKLWQKCVKISMEDAQNIFEDLNIKMTLNDTKGESFYAPMCHSIVKDLIEKGIATKSEDNSVVVFFDKKSPLVIQKSNGNFLYGLYDIAALKWRQENYNPDKIIYVVDKRQSLHFEQVFEVAKKANYIKDNVILQHVGFGTILGKDKKPLKTKEGEILYLENLMVEGKEILNNSDYFKKMDSNIKNEIIQKSIVGGMKFYDLKFSKTQDYVFDWEYVLNFSGGSAPYIQNAMTRIDSIFHKMSLDVNNKTNLNWNETWTTEEKNILFQSQKCFEVAKNNDKDYASQTLSENIIKLCQLFHKYYDGDTIIGNVKQEQKLNLINYVYHCIKENIDILGIESYECTSKLISKLNKKVNKIK